MTRRERMLAAIAHEGVDHVPFATYNLHPCAGSIHVGDASYAPLLDLVAEKAGMLCKLSVSRMLLHESPRYMETLVEQQEDRKVTKQIMCTPRGDLQSVTVKPASQPAYVTEHFIKTDEDVERFMSLRMEPVEPDISDAVSIDSEVGERGLVYVGYPDPMNVTATLFDFEDYLLRCVSDLGGVLRLIDFVFEFVAEQVRLLARACRGRSFLMFTGGPEKATPPMMPPELFARLVTPYEKKLVGILHDEGLRVRFTATGGCDWCWTRS